MSSTYTETFHAFVVQQTSPQLSKIVINDSLVHLTKIIHAGIHSIDIFMVFHYLLYYSFHFISILSVNNSSDLLCNIADI